MFIPGLVLDIVLLIGVAFVSALVSFILIRRAKRRFSERMRRIRVSNYYRTRHIFPSLPEMPRHYQDFIGDSSCRYNARSYHLRCAVNPMGPCEDCPLYEPESPF